MTLGKSTHLKIYHISYKKSGDFANIFLVFRRGDHPTNYHGPSRSHLSRQDWRPSLGSVTQLPSEPVAFFWFRDHDFYQYMDVSKNSGFSPQIIHFNRVFHYKPSILGYPYFWKHPHGSGRSPSILSRWYNLSGQKRILSHQPLISLK